ncbi:MAG: YoaK family protein [Treponema sp.]|uniref:YoaK family protein n=1 Tax=Treponema sp. TaxID=166 RepID=UPI003FA29F8C
MNEKKQTVSGNIHESLCVALILALLGGFLDAYTFILKNGVFANAQTGNLILLSVSLFNGEYGRVPQYLLPIVFFSLGILLSEYIKETPGIKPSARIKIVLLFKAAVLIVIGFTSSRTNPLFTTCTVSFLAAVQVGIFNKMEGSAVATTMITGNLKSSMQCLYAFFCKKDKRAGKVFVQYIAVIVFFGIGAGIGAFLTRTFLDNSIYFCLIFIFAAYSAISLRAA